LAAGKGEQLLCQSCCALGSDTHHLDALLGFVIATNRSAEKTQAANDDRQQVVEVVRYPTGHPAH
jgi:hypothetical protein